MSATPQRTQKVITRSTVVVKIDDKTNNSKSSQKKEKKNTGNNDATQNKSTPTTPGSNTTRYVCSICTNTESIRCSRLKLETDLLSTLTDKFDEIKSSLSEDIDKIESIDLHVKHLLLNRDEFEKYQSNVSNIENMCTEIVNDINQLKNNEYVRPPSNIDNAIDSNDSFDVIKQSNAVIENKISSINASLQLINKTIHSTGPLIDTNSIPTNIQFPTNPDPVPTPGTQLLGRVDESGNLERIWKG